MLEDVKKAIVELKIEDIADLVESELEKGSSPNDLLNILGKGMEEVGLKFERGDYFFSELIMAGETMKEALKILKPKLEVSEFGRKGKIILGTIKGDLHDIGKDIVSTLLISAGFEVLDLGIDVPPKVFAEKAKSTNAKIVGVSALLSVTVPTLEEVDKSLKEAGIRDRVKLIAGGAAVREEYANKLGLDAAVNNAVEGVNIIKSWVK